MWPEKTVPFREGLTPQRLFDILKEYKDTPERLLLSIVTEEREVVERARKEKEDRERLQRSQAEARTREALEKERQATERQAAERAERKRLEEIRQSEIELKQQETVLLVRQEAIARESSPARPFSFHSISNDVPVSEVREFVSQLLEAYRKSEHGWILNSELISTVKVDLQNKVSTPSMTQNMRGNLPPDILFTLGLNTGQDAMTQTFDMAGKRLSDFLLTESDAGLKIKALTTFLKQAYKAEIQHRISDPSQRKQRLVAQCLENIHSALRMLTPEELERVHELNLSTPEDPILIKIFTDFGKIFEQVNEHIDPGFATAPETIAKQMRRYFSKVPKK